MLCPAVFFKVLFLNFCVIFCLDPKGLFVALSQDTVLHLLAESGSLDVTLRIKNGWLTPRTTEGIENIRHFSHLDEVSTSLTFYFLTVMNESQYWICGGFELKWMNV